METILLENDNFMWTGLEDFCKSFDPNYVKLCTDVRDHSDTDDYMAIGMLVQPSVKRLIVASAFESHMYLPHIDREEYWQVEHYLKLIWAADKVREHLKLGGFTVEINYHGHDFIEDIKREKWGYQFSTSLRTYIRQRPDTLTVNVYDEYKFKYRLTEENMY